MSSISDNLLVEFADKEFRDAYVESRTRNLIAYQVRALREQRGMSQQQLAEKLPSGAQSTVSRAEDPDYGRLSLTSLLLLASAFDTGLEVKFCSHEDFLANTADLSPGNLEAPSYHETRVNHAVKSTRELYQSVSILNFENTILQGDTMQYVMLATPDNANPGSYARSNYSNFELDELDPLAEQESVVPMANLMRFNLIPSEFRQS